MTTVDPYEAKISDPACLRMRRRTGRVDDVRPLVSFFYELARDYLPVGVIEEAAQHAIGGEAERGPFMFTNGWLARWAQDLADRFDGAQGGDL